MKVDPTPTLCVGGAGAAGTSLGAAGETIAGGGVGTVSI